MISLRNKQRGFTIVELLIVIVVIGILAALVITTFSGVQRKARNSERQTDTKAVADQLEAYHAEKGFYPTNANLDSDAFVQAELKGLDLEALKDPKGTSNDVADTGSAQNVYTYIPAPAGCDNTAGNECASFQLLYVPEPGTAATTKSSLN